VDAVGGESHLCSGAGRERGQETDDDLVTAQELEIELPGAIVGAVSRGSRRTLKVLFRGPYGFGSYLREGQGGSGSGGDRVDRRRREPGVHLARQVRARPLAIGRGGHGQ
jgi:hypothetical protein